MCPQENVSNVNEQKLWIITTVDGLGQKVVAAAIEFTVNINSAALFEPADFSVTATRTDKTGNKDTAPRTVTRVYPNTEPALSDSSTTGSYLILELDPNDTNAKTIYHDRDSGLTTSYNLTYTVSYKHPIRTDSGNTIRPGTIAGTNRINLVVDDFALLTFQDRSGQTMPYRLFVPKNYDPDKKYPLVLFLHGAGERGRDGTIHLQANEGAIIWARTSEQAKRECFVLAPQCPPNRSWTNKLLTDGQDPFRPTQELNMAYAILEKVLADYNIDRNRIYLTGLSMGGFGTWALGIAHPHTFAALVPICGGGDPDQVQAIADKPIWAFHHAGDPVVPVEMTRAVVQKLEEKDENNYYRPVLYTEYPAEEPLQFGNHSSWVPAYRTEAMREWLFSQRLGIGVKKIKR